MDNSNTDLVLDVGNTRTKLAQFAAGRLVRRDTLPTGDMDALVAATRGLAPARIAVGSVAAPDEQLLAYLRAQAPTLLITGTTPSPLRSAYATPATLGVDRLANAVAAAAMFPGRAALAVDLGTCITYDLVDAGGTYRGGAITPGMRMRAKALHAYSARLPEVQLTDAPDPWGTSTDEALRAGIHHGILGEMRHFMDQATHEGTTCAVVLTGGDAVRFARAAKRGIFAHPFLTLEGLRLILHHHGVPAGTAGASVD